MKIINDIKAIMGNFGKTLKKASDPGLVGKIVAVDSKYRSGDGHLLVHIYIITSTDGNTGRFIGNLKKIRRFIIWKPSDRNHPSEPISDQRIITHEESVVLLRAGVSNLKK